MPHDDIQKLRKKKESLEVLIDDIDQRIAAKLLQQAAGRAQEDPSRIEGRRFRAAQLAAAACVLLLLLFAVDSRHAGALPGALMVWLVGLVYCAELARHYAARTSNARL